MSIPFLRTQWRNLLVATYAAPEELLAKHLPPGVELDRRDGQAFCSLVGFQFRSTSVFGVPSPLFRNFPEWNLRIYVRRGPTRGVHFVREFVPHRLITWAGRLTFNEPFVTAPMTAVVESGAGQLTVAYTVTRGGRTHRMSAVADERSARPDRDEAFFTELNWAFGRSRRGELTRFEVTRPEWETHRVREFAVDVDWEKLYGPEWATMSGRTPCAVSLGRGSEVRAPMPVTVATAASARRLRPSTHPARMTLPT